MFSERPGRMKYGRILGIIVCLRFFCECVFPDCSMSSSCDNMSMNRALVVGSFASVALMLLAPSVSLAASYRVDIADNSFSGKAIVINAGDSITWINGGSMAHTVTSDGGSFDSQAIPPGQTFTYTFNAQGSFPYYCRYHGNTG